MNALFAGLVFLLLSLALWSVGCATDGTTHEPASPVAALFKADSDFAIYAQQHGVVEAFREFAAADGMSLPMGEEPVRGRDAIFQAMSGFPPGQLLWKPVGADVARSDDIGYTWCTYEFLTRGSDGKSVTRHGKYVTVWKRQRDGSWKFVVDIGNSSPPPK